MKKNLMILFIFGLLFSIVPSEVYANINNSFEDHDKYYDEKILKSKSKYTDRATLNEPKNELTNETTPVGNNRYMVKFREDVSLGEIYNLIAGYNYKIIGRSKNHLFRIDIDRIEEFNEFSKVKVEWIEKDAQEKLSIIPNDPYISEQWAINALSLPEAWDITQGSNSISVAVIDSGVSRTHPDLSNEKILNGWDLLNDTYVNWDTLGHGTQVTGVIAATPNNSLGISGTCWNVSILPLAVVDNEGRAYTSDVVDAIYRAADSGCKVINISLGGSEYNSAEYSAIQYAISKGCIVVASAGNDYDSTINYPASYNNVISVASVNKYLAHSNFSNNNSFIDVSAPGEEIYTTMNDDSYAYVAGTSFSAPYVSGIAALAASYIPDLTSSQFQSAISATSTDLGTAGYDNYYGHGLINAKRLLSNLTTIPVTGVSLNKSSITLNGGESETLIATIAPVNATNQKVIWSSSNSVVATVDSNGKVTGIYGGTSVITAKTVESGLTAICTVTVKVLVTGVSLNKNSTTINVGGSEALFRTITPANASDQEVLWTSNNIGVATVNSIVNSVGTVVGISAGVAEITATTVDGSLTATCTVTVKVPVTFVSLNKSDITINVGTNETLIPTITPSNATNQNVTWASENPEVASVDSSGKVVGESAGTTNITVTTADGSLRTSCIVTVTEKYSAQFLVKLGVNTNHENIPGIYISINDINDSDGNHVTGVKLANYQIMLKYDANMLCIPDVYDEEGLGTLTSSISSGLVYITDRITSGFENQSNLVFVPIVLKGSAIETTNVTIQFSELQDQFQNGIQAEPIVLTFQRGKILNDENSNPTITDAVAGLQYLANIRTVGDAKGQVNPVNMASILLTDPSTGVLKPSVKDVIALMQQLAGLRDEMFVYR